MVIHPAFGLNWWLGWWESRVGFPINLLKSPGLLLVDNSSKNNPFSVLVTPLCVFSDRRWWLGMSSLSRLVGMRHWMGGTCFSLAGNGSQQGMPRL